MRVWNKRTENPPAGAVYVGRPTKWGNPYPITATRDRAQAIRMFEEWASATGLLQEAREELRGKDLVCWCAPEACHADILMKEANK